MNTHFEKISLTINRSTSGIVTIAQRDCLVVIPPEYIRDVAMALAAAVRRTLSDDEQAVPR